MRSPAGSCPRARCGGGAANGYAPSGGGEVDGTDLEVGGSDSEEEGGGCGWEVGEELGCQIWKEVSIYRQGWLGFGF